MFGISLLLFPLVLFLDNSAPASNPEHMPRAHFGERSPAERGTGGEGTFQHSSASKAPDWLPLADALRPVRARQVRIEQRVIIRIVPLGRKARPNTLANTGTSIPLRLVERPVSGCVPIREIAGVSADRDERLRLHMRGRQILSIRFDRNCPTEAFYSGFYVEQNGDGLLCPARDTIHSRSGVRCTVGKIGQLVAERAD